MSKVKICGITNAQDALWVVNLGADLIGLNFYPASPRKVSVKHAKELVAQVPPFVGVVGLFVDEPIESILKAIKSVPLKYIQLHGNESPEYCAQVRASGVKVIKAFRLQQPVDPAMLTPYDEYVDFYLFDSHSDTQMGGTGQTFTWEWLQPAASVTKPWFLAGGLNPDNIVAAIKATHPAYVDVCSGVEKSQTRKDYDKMKSFIQGAKSIR